MKRFLTGRWGPGPAPCPVPRARRRRHRDGGPRGPLRRPRRDGSRRPAGRHVWPRRVRRTGCHRRANRKVTRKLLHVTVRRGVLRTAGRLVWPLHARHLVVAAFCGGARSSNDYSSGRRERLEAAVEIRSPRITDQPCERLVRHASGCSAKTDARGRHAVPGGLHAAQTTHGQNPPRAELHPKQRKSAPTNSRCDAVHDGSSCRIATTDLSS